MLGYKVPRLGIEHGFEEKIGGGEVGPDYGVCDLRRIVGDKRAEEMRCSFHGENVAILEMNGD